MYFFRTNALKEKLKTRTLTDREALPYVIMFGLVTLITIAFTRGDNSHYDLQWLMDLTEGLLMILGIIYCYRRNGGSEGYDFVLKYMTLGWVIFIRCLLFLIPVIIIGSLIATFLIYRFSSGEFEVLIELGLGELAWIVLFYVVYYLRLGKHLSDTSTLLNKEAGAEAYEKHMMTERESP